MAEWHCQQISTWTHYSFYPNIITWLCVLEDWGFHSPFVIDEAWKVFHALTSAARLTCVWFPIAACGNLSRDELLVFMNSGKKNPQNMNTTIKQAPKARLRLELNEMTKCFSERLTSCVGLADDFCLLTVAGTHGAVWCYDLSNNYIIFQLITWDTNSVHVHVQIFTQKTANILLTHSNWLLFMAYSFPDTGTYMEHIYQLFALLISVSLLCSKVYFL